MVNSFEEVNAVNDVEAGCGTNYIDELTADWEIEKRIERKQKKLSRSIERTTDALNFVKRKLPKFKEAIYYGSSKYPELTKKLEYLNVEGIEIDLKEARQGGISEDHLVGRSKDLDKICEELIEVRKEMKNIGDIYQYGDELKERSQRQKSLEELHYSIKEVKEKKHKYLKWVEDETERFLQRLEDSEEAEKLEVVKEMVEKVKRENGENYLL